MRKVFLIPIIIGSVLLVTGGAVFALGMSNRKADASVTNQHDITDTYENFDISLATANLSFKVSEDGKTKVVCVESEKRYHDVEVKDNTLTIKHHDETKWFERLFNFDFSKRSVTIYLPEAAYGSLVINSSTGDVDIPNNFSFKSANIGLSTGDIKYSATTIDSITIKSSTGDVKVSGLATKEATITTSTGKINAEEFNVENKLSLTSSTGNITLKTVRANELAANASTSKLTLIDTVLTGDMTVKTSTGDVILDGSDAANLDIQTGTGDVKGTLLTNKLFDAHSRTGKVKVPPIDNIGGLGICKVNTHTGDIIISIKA